MKLFLRPTHLCVMAACLCQALSANPCALSQTALAAVQQAQNAQTESLPSVLSRAAAMEADAVGEQQFVYEQFAAGKPLMKVCRLCTIRSFATEIGIEDSTTRYRMKEDPRIKYTRYNYTKILKISEDEERAMHAIVLDTYYRLQENEKQEEEHNILHEARAKLEQLLGEDFKKLDAYVYKGLKMNAVVAPPASISDPTHPGDNSDPKYAPEAKQ
jgi:hypothetical protein